MRDFLETSAVVDTVIQSRKTTRAFRTDEVPNAVVNDMLAIASSAPSTFNTQPWQVHVLTGKPKNALSEALLHAHLGNTQAPYAAMPNPAPPDCAARQEEFGRRYYSVLGIDRIDMAARSRQTARNYVFFDAPVGGLSEISCVGGHREKEGALLGHDAKPHRYPMSFWTSCLPAVRRAQPLIREVCSTI